MCSHFLCSCHVGPPGITALSCKYSVCVHVCVGLLKPIELMDFPCFLSLDLKDKEITLMLLMETAVICYEG